MTDLEPTPHRKRNMVRAFLGPVVIVVAFALLVAQRVDTNAALAREARRGVIAACDAVKASNDVTVGFLRTSIVPPPSSARYLESKAFVDGLAAEYVTAYNACIVEVES